MPLFLRKVERKGEVGVLPSSTTKQYQKRPGRNSKTNTKTSCLKKGCLALFAIAVLVFPYVMIVNENAVKIPIFPLSGFDELESANVTVPVGLLPADVIPFFYINLDKSTDRRQSLERDFVVALQEHHSLTAALNRVPAISTTEVELMLQNGTFILNGIDNLRYEIKRKHKKEYSYNEAACTLSHLKAIKQAYDEGRDIAIVIEDDVNITKEFMENWKQYIAQAPRDWKVLQMTTNNNDINKQELHKVHDYWINWEPSHWATISYVINREHEGSPRAYLQER